MAFESNVPAAVALCGTKSWFCQMMRSPRCTLSEAGWNCMPSITMVCVCRAASVPVKTRQAAAKAAACQQAEGRFVARTDLLGERCLQLFGVLKMGNEGGARLL